jgi:hypothetical protein
MKKDTDTKVNETNNQLQTLKKSKNVVIVGQAEYAGYAFDEKRYHERN